MQVGTHAFASSSASAGTTPRVLVQMATYNERDNVARLIDEIHQHAPSADVLVIDDNSPDGTGDLIDELGRKDSRIHCIHRNGKLGLGTAIVAGMRFAMARDYDYLVNMDADGSHPAKEIPALIAGMKRHDVMIGSRYVPGGGTVNWPISRLIISRSVNILVRLLLRFPVKDASGGFRCYRVELLRRTRLDRLISKGYSFQQEMLFRCRQAGARVGEHPIIFENRRAGVSKVNLRESIRSLGTLVWLGISATMGWERPRSIVG